MTSASTLRIGSIFLVTGLFCSACATSNSYPDISPQNLGFEAHTSVEGIFTRLDAEMHISAVRPDCGLDYLGSVKVKAEPAQLGLKEGQLHYLVITLQLETFGQSDQGATRAAMITPQKGHRYKLWAQYSRTEYQLKLFEAGPEGDLIPIAHEPYACEPR